MALHFSSACNFGLSQKKRAERIRAVASNEFVKVKTEEDKLVKLGGSDLKLTKLGIGAWSWGDTSYWNNFEWDDRKMKACKNAFDASIDSGITWFDTAEVYGSRFSFGAINSETLLGRKKKHPEDEIAVATKFAALPWRLGRESVLSALKDSLSRLELDSVELYQLHWPGIWGNEEYCDHINILHLDIFLSRTSWFKHPLSFTKKQTPIRYIDGLGDAVEQGLVKAVGVSNYSGGDFLILEKRLREAYKQLKKRGIPLAANQVNYSLIYRIPEENGVKATCDELGISLIAYSPIAQGVLTGKYTPQNIPTLQPLINRIKEIGESYDKTPTQVCIHFTPLRLIFKRDLLGPLGLVWTYADLTVAYKSRKGVSMNIDILKKKYMSDMVQVALNWLIAQDNVIPIPGAKNAEQAKEFGGALGWRLTNDEVNELRDLASKSKPTIGFPVEKM
ncbi:hypothetical protein OSB04_021143 [Centaurea solstitialis]|uniref:NADP-dependent oxidoreductase domain-containing protein n=1 Tax=Centaurea solstitialis TaxID=347529 RepID=A0AA38WDY5_9ASTR|nr:hypothetical protein OSB04_021143 [Centaurea solstitialis]